MKAQDLKDAYYAVRIDGRYDLYDKDPNSGSRTCHKYLGSVVYNSKSQSVMFNGKRYTIIRELENALKEWEESLPFSVECYNPIIREEARTRMCISEYLERIGMERKYCISPNVDAAYILKTHNVYFGEQALAELTFKVNEDGKSGEIGLFHDSCNNAYVSAKFSSLENAIESINSLIEPLLLCSVSKSMELHSKMSKARSCADIGNLNIISYKTFDTYSVGLKDKIISELEEALKRLKED